MKSLLKNLIISTNILRKLYFFLQSKKFNGSKKYWENRYKTGGNSGEGSYNESAVFKATFINDFIKDNNIKSVIEFGCGDGNQLAQLDIPTYTGLDVSKESINIISDKFKNDLNKSFFLYSPEHFINNGKIFSAEVTLSLDVIYHLVEDDIFEKHLEHLFLCSKKYVIIFSNNEESTGINTHVRNRKFTDNIQKNYPGWDLKLHKKNSLHIHKHSPPIDFFIYEKKN